MAAAAPSWLVLVHAIPPKPAYLRVKIGRRLQKIGAVAIKNSVYALPLSEGSREDLAWVSKEIVREGGEASILEARFVEGLSNGEVKALFTAARDADYSEVLADLRRVASKADREMLRAELDRFRKRVNEIAEIDFFGAPGRAAVEAKLRELAEKLQPPGKAEARAARPGAAPRGATWVTRTGIHVDRMASAWLIRRFIDPKARFRFVSPRNYQHRPGELRFDMFEGEFTHEGDACSFEVLLRRFDLDDPALRPIAELIHDVDLKDAKYGRPETAGFERVVAAIAMAHPEDEERLARASAVLDDLHHYYRRKR